MSDWNVQSKPEPSKNPDQQKGDRDVEFLFEMGTIRFIERMWRRFLHHDFANLAEHHFRMFWIAMILAAREGNADTGKIAKMVLVHDIVESRTGDVDYLARQYVERNEELGINDMLDNTSIHDEFVALWQEYEARETLEAKIAKDADNLDVDFELMEQKETGAALTDRWKSRRSKLSQRNFYTKSAKAIYEEILLANPHAWHIHGRNRTNAGDWKKFMENDSQDS